MCEAVPPSLIYGVTLFVWSFTQAMRAHTHTHKCMLFSSSSSSSSPFSLLRCIGISRINTQACTHIDITNQTHTLWQAPEEISVVVFCPYIHCVSVCIHIVMMSKPPVFQYYRVTVLSVIAVRLDVFYRIIVLFCSSATHWIVNKITRTQKKNHLELNSWIVRRKKTTDKKVNTHTTKK